MKKNFCFVVLTLAGLLVAASCNKTIGREDQLQEQPSSLTVSWDDAVTKAEATALEKQLNDLYFFVFDTNGMLEIVKQCTPEERAAKSASMSVKTGVKTVWALANLTGTSLTAALAASTISVFEAVAFDLSQNTASNFVMSAKGSTTVVATTGGSLPLSLTRPVARVALGTVVNSLPAPYGAVTVKQAFLCNVVGNENIGGNATASTWYNQEATPDHGGADHVIGTGSYTANIPAMTFVTLNTSLDPGGTVIYNDKFMYGFKNSLDAVPGNPGYNTIFRETCSVLMLVVTVKSKDYYYPIALSKKLVANTNNVVNVTLQGLGNTVEEGVFNKIEKASLTATVTVTNWTDVDPYTETI